MTLKLTTRGAAPAEAIRDLKPFKTNGALYAMDGGGLHRGASGRLSGVDLDVFLFDLVEIDYIVFSYNTPIAWHTPAGWHKVAQKFSATTSAHQGRLYLIESAR